MPPNAFSDLFAYITQLMVTNAPMFEAMGQRMYAAFTVIVIVWFGIEWAFHGGMRMERFANMMMMVAFGFAMTRYYSQPIPGFGISFYHLIVDQGTVLANQLNNGIVTQVFQRLDLVYMGLTTPGVSVVFNVMEVVRWLVIVLAIVACEAAVFLVISFGYIAVAICVLLGPVFIPFFIVPKMEWVFWGWLRALLQYAFYPVVANAYVFVVGNLLINFTDRAGTDFSGAALAVVFIPFLFLLVAATLGVLRVPSLVNSIFSGKSGEGTVPYV